MRGVARQVKVSVDAGVQVGIVTGGGNYWRGRTSEAIARTKADQIGMLATIMNCIYIGIILSVSYWAKKKDDADRKNDVRQALATA